MGKKPEVARMEALYRNKEARERAGRTAAESERVIYWHEYDHAAFVCVFVLLAFGLMMVLSSSYYIAMVDPKTTTFHYFISQSRAAALGFPIMFIAAIFNYRYLKPFVWILYIGSNALVIATKYIGVTINGATRWINVPLFGTFQPSELAKAALILTLAFFICGGKSADGDEPNRAKKLSGILMCVALTAIPSVLVFVFNSNLSTALIIAIIGVGVTFVACPYTKFMLAAGGGLAGVAGVAGYYLYKFAPDTNRWAERIRSSVDPWSDPSGGGYQTIQSLYAVASGGLVGLGLGRSNQKLKYMPEPQNDFIFAVVCEELGFVGAFLVLFLFGVLIWRGVKIAINATELTGCLLATGIVTQIAAQVIVNVAVVTNTGINTGVPMPFISAGGTSLLILMAMTGVLLNISRYSND